MVRLDPLDPLAASELKHRDRYDGRIACLVHRGKDVEIVNPAKSDRGGEAAGTIVLKFPGNAGRAERSGPFALSAIGDPTGVCVTWNPPGYGDSDGPARLHGYAEAALSMTVRSINRYGDGASRVWLCGNSMGCCAAAFVASRLPAVHQPVGVILRNPPPLSDVVMSIARRYPGGRWMRSVAESLPPAMNITEQLATVRCPIVWCCSGSDRLVPPKLQRSVFDRCPAEVMRIDLPGLAHNDVPDPDQQKLIDRTIASLAGR